VLLLHNAPGEEVLRRLPLVLLLLLLLLRNSPGEEVLRRLPLALLLHNAPGEEVLRRLPLVLLLHTGLGEEVLRRLPLVLLLLLHSSGEEVPRRLPLVLLLHNFGQAVLRRLPLVLLHARPQSQAVAASMSGNSGGTATDHASAAGPNIHAVALGASCSLCVRPSRSCSRGKRCRSSNRSSDPTCKVSEFQQLVAAVRDAHTSE